MNVLRRFVKAHLLKLLAFSACPFLAVASATCFLTGGSGWDSLLYRSGVQLFALAMVLLLPLGLFNVRWSMRNPVDSAESDSRDLMDFLLGSAGMIQIILGVILSPVTLFFVLVLYQQSAQ